MRTLLAVAAVLVSGGTLLASAADDTAAMALAKKSKCLNCHAVDKKKDGPAFKDVAAKYKGKPDAEAVLVKHLTTNPTIRVDGKDEKHDNLLTKNDAEVKNVVHWILTR
jgi:cytochrome c